MDGPRRIVVVGAGHGGATAAALLRQQGFAGEVLLLSAEPVAPYHRPPLSKAFLDEQFAQPLKHDGFYVAQEIELRLGARATAVDRERREVALAGGERVAYDVLVLATGSIARRLPIPGADLSGVHELRTLADAERLREVVRPGAHLCIVGGGYIGLEVAATARRHGAAVTVIEREDRVLARVASRELSDFLTAHHRARGTEILVAAEVSRFERGSHGHVASVVLAGGRAIACDAVLVGVGAAADDDLARRAGLACDDGVVVDDQARTADPAVYAIGDMTRRPLHGRDGLFRLESIPSAVEQARRAVGAILDRPAGRPEVPWFWSDQFDLKLKIAGLLEDADDVTVRGDVDAGRFALLHTAEGRLVAVEAVNAPAEFMAGKNAIRDAVAVTPTPIPT